MSLVFMMAMKANFYDIQDGFHDGGAPLPPKSKEFFESIYF
jgi:hypothetical protein